jgi:serine/threonine protein kinase
MTQTDPDASASSLIGTDIGPYRLVRRLGMGGMAETFVAVRRGPGGFTQRVCLKLVLPFHRGDREFLDLFHREARLAAKLRHSNIVGVLDFGEVDERSYMALELIDGVDLQVLLDSRDGRRLSHEHVALIGYDIASALHHAHNPPHDSDVDGSPPPAIIHRDVSPSNVLISRHGEVKLGDFGVAKSASANTGQQSNVKGKVPYMSPEQLRLHSLDGRADLFGVGVVLFEALCGRKPYEGGHDPGTILLILDGRHVPLHSLAPTAPAELCAVIDRLIDPDRDKRPASAAELISLLEPFVPPPRVRRELAEMIDQLTPLASSPSNPPPEIEYGATELSEDRNGVQEYQSGIVETSPAAGSIEASSAMANEAGRRKRRRLAWAFALLTASAVAAAFWWSTNQAASPASESASAAESDPTTAVREAPEDDEPSEAGATDIAPTAKDPIRAEESSVASERQAVAAPPAKPKVAPAKLTVVVIPWGEVWVNGERRGTSPVRNLSLRPGRYRVAAGQGKPMVSKVVRLRSGQSQTLELDVTKR